MLYDSDICKKIPHINNNVPQNRFTVSLAFKKTYEGQYKLNMKQVHEIVQINLLPKGAVLIS